MSSIAVSLVGSKGQSGRRGLVVVVLWMGVFFSRSGFGEQLLGTYAWSTTQPAPAGTHISVASEGTGAATGGFLEVVREAPSLAPVPLLVIEHPALTSTRYALSLRVASEGLTEPAYLELWSVFADGRRYFTRSLGSGVLAPILGESGWRPLVLPFDATGAEGPPVRLELNLVMGGTGRVTLLPAALVQYGDDETTPWLPAPSRAWWGARTAGLIGGVAGTVLGLLGALVGWLVGRGRARGVVMSLLAACTGLGALLLGVGVVAVVYDQPYAVTFTLFMLGGLSFFVMGTSLITARRRYQEQELRRLQALDAR